MPSLYILYQLFSSSNDQATPSTQIHLQDYNTSVLELVTLPNVLLTWCTSYISHASIKSKIFDWLKMHRRYPYLTVHQ